MSVKQLSFLTAIPQPQVTSNFIIRFEGLTPLFSAIVQSASLPQESISTTKISVRGTQVVLPSKPKNSGVWEASFPDSIFGIVGPILTARKFDTFSKTTLNERIFIPFKIDIFPTISNSEIPVRAMGVQLESVFLTEIKPVRLQASGGNTVWMWDVSFAYSIIRMIGVKGTEWLSMRDSAMLVS